MNIVITIPAYNEEATIKQVIEELNKVMKATKYSYKILVIDDGSEDRTAEISRKAGAIVSSNSRNMGLADTFKEEIKQCLKLKADIIVHTDADGQYAASSIPRMIKKIEEGYDLVLGSRFLGKIEYMPLTKRLGNKAFAMVLSKLSRIKLTDTTTGFRAFTREVAEKINFINTFTYTQEQIIKAAKLNFKIAEVPIMARETRESKLFRNPLDYAVKAWINILRIYRDYEPLKFFGLFGLFFVCIGVLIGIWLLYLFFTTGRVGHTPSQILVLLLITIGIQISLFGFLADMNRKN